MVLVVILGYQTSGGGPSIEITSIEEIFPLTSSPGKHIRVLLKDVYELYVNVRVIKTIARRKWWVSLINRMACLYCLFFVFQL